MKEIKDAYYNSDTVPATVNETVVKNVKKAFYDDAQIALARKLVM